MKMSGHLPACDVAGSPLFLLVVAGYELVRDNDLKYKSSLTSTTSVVLLWH